MDEKKIEELEQRIKRLEDLLLAREPSTSGASIAEQMGMGRGRVPLELPLLTPAEKDVLDFLKECRLNNQDFEGVDAETVSEHFKISRSLATRYLRQLERIGLAESKDVNEGGRWKVRYFPKMRE